MKIRKAVIPAAGLGTRFLPATKAIPKEMVPIVDQPTLQYIVEEAAASGIEDILIITGRTKRAIEDHFDKSYELETELEKSGKLDYLNTLQKISNLANIHYVRQKEAKGLGHAIYCAKFFAENEPFAVLLGDDVVDSETPCLAQMIKQYEDCGASVLGVQTVPDSETSKYGIVSGEKISDRLLNEIDSGVTYLHGQGAYSNQNKKVIMCVTKKQQAPGIEEIVKEEDPQAFMIVSSASEIFGEGYKNIFAEKI